MDSMSELTVRVTIEPTNVPNDQVSVYRDLLDRPVIAIAHPHVDSNAVGEAVLALMQNTVEDERTAGS